MQKFITDFEYKNERDYIHSTTMIHALSKIIHNGFYPEEEWEVPGIDARFHKPVHCNGKFYVSEERPDLDKINTVSAAFRYYDARHAISAVFVEDKDTRVVNRIKTEYYVEDIVAEGDFSGTCMIGCPSTNAMIENIIEANKKIHQMTLKDKESLRVVNLYMKKLPVSLPASNMLNSGKVQLKIKNVGARTRDDSVATLNSLSFPETSKDSFELSYVVYW